MYLLGMDGMEYLTTKDHFTRNVMAKVAQEAVEQKPEWDLNLAKAIASEVSKIFG